MLVHRVLVLLALVLAAALAASGPASARYLQTGIADDAVLLNGGARADEAVADWQAVGIDTVRIQVSWARVAPNPRATTPPVGFQPTDPNDPLYDWGAIDGAVDRLVKAGIKPMLMLDGPPPLWGSGNPQRGRYRATDRARLVVRAADRLVAGAQRRRG